MMFGGQPVSHAKQPLVERHVRATGILVDRPEHRQEDLLAEVFGFRRAAQPVA